MLEFDVWIRGELDELRSAKLEAAGMPVREAHVQSVGASQGAPLTAFVRVTAQSEAMARAQVAAVLEIGGTELRAFPA